MNNTRDGRGAAALILLVVFAVGVLCGAAGHRLLERPRVRHQVRIQIGGGAAVYEGLGLTNAQRTQIDSVLKRIQPRTDSLLRSTLPQIRQLVDSTDREIRRILTPDQVRRLDDLKSPSQTRTQ